MVSAHREDEWYIESTGQRHLIVGDAAGGVLGDPEVWSCFDAFGNDVDIVVKASSGYLGSVIVSNINAAIRYAQLWERTTAPSNGHGAAEGLVAVAAIPGNGGSASLPGFGGFSFFGGGRAFTTGIVVTVSTTMSTFTAATTSDHIVTGQYV